jgi:hypothetical protein
MLIYDHGLVIRGRRNDVGSFDGLNQTQRLVRRIESNQDFCSNERSTREIHIQNLELSVQLTS